MNYAQAKVLSGWKARHGTSKKPPKPAPEPVKAKKITPPGRLWPTPVHERAAALANKADGVIRGYAITWRPVDRSRVAIFGVELPAHKAFVHPPRMAKETLETAADPLPLWFEHREDQPIGVVKAAWADNYGVFIVGELDLASEQAQEAWRGYRHSRFGFSTGGGVKVIGPLQGAKDTLVVSYSLSEISLTARPADEKAVSREPMLEGPYHARLLQRALDPDARFAHWYMDEETAHPTRPVYCARAIDASTGKTVSVGWFYPASHWTSDSVRYGESPGSGDGGTRFYDASEKRPMLTQAAA
jgi:hypothetical protein